MNPLSHKIYTDLKMKHTSVDTDGSFPCCQKSVMRRFKSDEKIPEGMLVICDECDDGMALFDGVWSACYGSRHETIN